MQPNKIFIIEHLEPEVYEWCIIEYKHISKIVGKDNLWFTNIQKKDFDKLSTIGKVFSESVSKLKLNSACVLDAESKVLITPKVADNFTYFIFGGILGDYPPRKRTKKELSSKLKGISTFNIGKEQMSTDNAIYTVKQIILGKEMSELKFQDKCSIKINDVLTTELPYRYNVVDGKPLISLELVKFIKNRDKI